MQSEDNVSDVATKNVSADTMEKHIDTITAERNYWNSDKGDQKETGD